MGICIQQYRYAIGTYNVLRSVRVYVGHHQPSCLFLLYVFGYFLYSLVIFALLLSLCIVLTPQGLPKTNVTYNCCYSKFYPNFVGLSLFNVSPNFLKIISDTFSTLMISYLYPRKRSFSLRSLLKTLSKSNLILSLAYLHTFCIVSLNIFLIIICNVSLLNPGPVSANLTLFYQNVHGLVSPRNMNDIHPTLNLTKIMELQSFISLHKFDIIMLSETWLKPSIKNHEIFPFTNYKVFRLDRSPHTHPQDLANPNKFKRNGGGVLIAVNSELGLNPTIVKSPCNAELLSVKLNLPGSKKICISNCYRVGTLGENNLSEISNRLHYITKSKQIKGDLLLGDFNLDSVDWPSFSSATNSLHNRFLSLFADLGFSQLLTSSTHYLGNILDLCLTSLPHLITNIRILEHNEAVKSDHFGITLELKYKCRKLKTPSFSIFNFSKANWEALNYELSRIPWDRVLGLCDIHVAWPKFKSILLSLCEKHIPKIKVNSKTSPPWFDSDIHKLCRKKERYRKLYKSTGNEAFNLKYKSCRKEVKSTIKAKMRSNFDDDSNPKVVTNKFWSYVKSSSNSSRIPETINYGARYRSESTDKANMFNEFFCKQFSAPSKYDIHINYANDPLFNFTIDFRSVRKILSSLNQNKSQGPDGINGKILKNCASSIAYPMTLLFNLSFSQGQLPFDWKLANVVPVHKKGDKSNVENYRPISLTSLIMKVFEKCIRDELLSLCSHRIHPSQHGFLPNRSCTTQLIPFIDKISLGLNNNVRTDVVYFDFAKAFDSVNHDIIIHKLKHNFGIDGLLLKFLQDYLHGRKQRVVLGSGISNEVDVVSGVPQGSILGPLLFVLFINDIHNVVSPGTDIALYADDTKIWRQILSEADCSALNNDIHAMAQWASSNLMTFHPMKCKVVSIAVKIFLETLPFQRIFPYSMNDILLPHEPSETDLGLLILKNLSWSKHQDLILSKALSQFNLLRRTCHFVKNSTKKRTLYLTIVRSLFEHCSSIWAPSLATVTNRFEPLQKRCVKWILNEQFFSYSDSVYHTKLHELKIMPLSYKFLYSDLILFYKVLNEIVPISLPEYVIRRTNTRSSSGNSVIFGLDLHSTINQKNVFTHSFFPRCITYWNNLPDLVRSSTTLNEFSDKLRTWIWASVTSKFTDFDIEPD